MEQLKQPEKVDKVVAIAVDVQNDFCPGGQLAVNEGDQVVQPLNRLFDYVRQENGLVVATADWHPANSRHFDQWPVHCIEDTEGAYLRSDLGVDMETIAIHKGLGNSDGYSAFEGQADRGETLEQILMPKHGERIALLIGGLATDYCVKSTVLDALKFAERIREKRLGKVAVFAIADAMRAVNLQPDDGEKAIAEMKAAGAIFVNTDEVLAGQVVQVA